MESKAVHGFDSVQFSSSVMSDSLQHHGLQHAKPLCPLPTPGGFPNSGPSSWWCHPTISSSVAPFSSHLQSFPASGFFLLSQLFASGSQSNWSFSFSISPSNEYSGLISFRIDWFDLLAVQGTLKSLLLVIWKILAHWVIHILHLKVNTSHYTVKSNVIKKFHLLIFPPNSEKVFKYL